MRGELGRPLSQKVCIPLLASLYREKPLCGLRTPVERDIYLKAH